ncbi:hypothetical protein [Pseudarthrobacter cellobiosi]|uniref:hypothetical protein n=1 Tax=Pseudarthrobacter cellobiosi TaxID=2953654 RepID=UPI00208EBAD3|nr:hypothetical protein [Pseudarthrobacter sp. HLT1-5]MCO4256524.1 hypothetical protein [Pseudarthrobacter sp. HLT1-5]
MSGLLESRFQNRLERPTSYGRRLKRVESKMREAELMAVDWLNSGWELVDTVEGSERVLAIRQFAPLDEEFEHLIYEIAEGLLATLDQVAFAIAGRHCPLWNDQQQTRSAFPIRDKELTNRSARRAFGEQVECWPEAALLALQTLQPYRYPLGPERAPLWLLRDLTNRGKHRTIAVVQSGMGLTNFSIGNGTIHRLEVIGSVDVITDEPQAYMRMSLANNVNASATIDVQIKFGAGPLLAGYSVMDSLNELYDYVRNTVLRKLLPFA